MQSKEHCRCRGPGVVWYPNEDGCQEELQNRLQTGSSANRLVQISTEVLPSSRTPWLKHLGLLWDTDLYQAHTW